MYYTPCDFYVPKESSVAATSLTGNILPASYSSPYPVSTIDMRNDPGIRCNLRRVQKPSFAAPGQIWLPEEDRTIIHLRNQGKGWLAISRHLPGRSFNACRLRYQNYLERWDTWDDNRKTQLARQYLRHKTELWLKVAKEMAVPPRAAEGMFWELGEKEIASRAGIIHSSHRLENPSSSFETKAGSIPINVLSKRSDLTNSNKKSTIQLPSLTKVLSDLSACPMVKELPAIQSSFT
ncbi:hypothetical protein N7530_012753 [Penicillium desertorum]|uniref:Myb-like domain-containing protein n=1 Tax=Penicillium desertorum TaxID=1303715 RepID=A0A9W9WDZ4_9EURO|nr:hypothetical protein N7530_012753 [Penicillium desertorum]